jgi:hypothetical protein
LPVNLGTPATLSFYYCKGTNNQSGTSFTVDGVPQVLPTTNGCLSNGGWSIFNTLLTVGSHQLAWTGSYWLTYAFSSGTPFAIADVVITSNLSAQTITVTTPSPITAADNTSFTAAATASSGLPVSITTMDGCTGGGTATATITMTGTSSDCTITYDQAGDGVNYDAAPELAFLVSLPKTVSHDYGGDGKADLLFVNTSTNATLIWSGAVKTAATYPGTQNTAYLYPGAYPTGFTIQK